MKAWQFYYKTDIGRIRKINEDNAYACQNNAGDILLLLLDGMGGHQKGDVASKLALDFIKQEFLKRNNPFTNNFLMKHWFITTIRNANNHVNKIASKQENMHGMGTTCVGVLISNDKTLFVNVGDSRGYVYVNKKLTQVTEDETYANFLYRSGKIKKEDVETHAKRNILTNALGVYPTLSVTPTFWKDPYERILLCSDGLYTMVKKEEMEEILKKSAPLAILAQELIDMANKNGGKDNIGVLICEVEK